MLTFMGMEGDAAPVRAAKLKALQTYYRESDPKAFAMLAADALATTNKDRGAELVINSHGNGGVFAGYTPADFLRQLRSKGFGRGSFTAIRLMACNVGEQTQSNSIQDNFAKELKRLLTIAEIDVKLYAPRGVLEYRGREKKSPSGTESWIEFGEPVIVDRKSKDVKEYTLAEGMLLVVL